MEFYLGNPASADKMWAAECASVASYCEGLGLDPGAGVRTLYEATLRLDRFEDLRPQIRGDAGALPFRDSVFDYVFSCHLLEHMEEPAAALREWLRVTRPGGYVAAVIPDTRFTGGQNTDRTPHHYEWSPMEFLAQVVWPGERRKAIWWEDTGPSAVLGAEVVSIGEACVGWSFHLVLQK